MFFLLFGLGSRKDGMLVDGEKREVHNASFISH